MNEKLDPVGKEDDDIDNDGDKDETDEYLLNRRKEIEKAMSDKDKKETQTESKDYHTKKNHMLHDMLLRKFGIKKGDK